MKVYIIHGKIKGIIEKFLLVNPVNVMVGLAEVEGELKGPGGNPLKTIKALITFPNRPPIVVEETVEELVEIFGEGKDAE